MKTLVGKIYRDENGVETIEREESKKNYKVDWKISLTNSGDESSTKFLVQCPYCGSYFYASYPKTSTAPASLKERAELYGMKSHTYCGNCGKRNITDIWDW